MTRLFTPLALMAMAVAATAQEAKTITVQSSDGKVHTFTEKSSVPGRLLVIDPNGRMRVIAPKLATSTTAMKSVGLVAVEPQGGSDKAQGKTTMLTLIPQVSGRTTAAQSHSGDDRIRELEKKVAELAKQFAELAKSRSQGTLIPPGEVFEFRTGLSGADGKKLMEKLHRQGGPTEAHEFRIMVSPDKLKGIEGIDLEKLMKGQHGMLFQASPEHQKEMHFLFEKLGKDGVFKMVPGQGSGKDKPAERFFKDEFFRTPDSKAKGDGSKSMTWQFHAPDEKEIKIIVDQAMKEHAAALKGGKVAIDEKELQITLDRAMKDHQKAMKEVEIAIKEGEIVKGEALKRAKVVHEAEIARMHAPKAAQSEAIAALKKHIAALEAQVKALKEENKKLREKQAPPPPDVEIRSKRTR